MPDLIFGGGLLAAIVLFCVAGPFLWSPDPLHGLLQATFKPPFTTVAGQFHPLGTDQLGRDLLARMIAGARLSLAIVLTAAAISAVLGTALGVIAGYARGWVDAVIMRLVDIQLAIPFILLILMIVAVLGPNLLNLVVVLGVTGWAVFARVARARTLEICQLEYIEAGRALGLPHHRLLAVHVLPNVLVPQIVLLTLDLPRVILLEASVGFLGLGVQPPTPTLGNLIGEGRSYMLLANWMVLYPGLLIAALIVGCNLLGDWLIHRTGARPG